MVDRRIKAAKFPAVKTLDSFDFEALPSLNRALVMEFARSEYVERRENLNSATPARARATSTSGSALPPASAGCWSASPPPPRSARSA